MSPYRKITRKLFRRRARHTQRADGFTLLELLVVLAILALLAGLVAPRVFNQLAGAKSGTAKIQIRNVESALELYRLDMGRYPTQNEGLEGLVSPPADTSKWRGPYLGKKDGLVDPWDVPYRYRIPGENGEFDIYSLGADKAEGGDGENKDIKN